MTLQIKILIGFLIILIILLFSAFTSYNITQKLTETASWVSHTHKVQTMVESVLSQLKDAETGQRGYLLTNNLSYLEPYESSIKKLHDILDRAKNLTIDNPIQQEHINQIEILSNQKLAELKETIELNKAGNITDAIEVVMTNHGKHTMDDIRAIIHDMHVEEEQLLLIRQQESDSAIKAATLIILFGSILAFSLIVFIAIIIVRDTNRYIIERKQAEEKLKYMATHDPLTKLNNRNELIRYLKNETLRASRYKHDLSVFMLDIDYFKSINDTHGHLNGDEVLYTFANILQNSIRNSDYVARYGGEEFFIILPETSLTKAKELAERLRSKIAEYQFPISDGKVLSLTTSIGIATFPEHAQTGEKLLEAADSAVYAAKKAGRNQVKYYGCFRTPQLISIK